MRKFFSIPFLMAMLAVLFLPKPGQAQHSNANAAGIEFFSSDTAMQRTFLWAREMALHYRGNPNDPVGPWYEAALPERFAFCMRDVSHQCIGAEILGMGAENRNMFQWFSKSISESKDWCSFWERNRHGLPAPADYKNDREFWYNLVANFDVIYAQWRLYEWTGDLTYLNDSEMKNFRTKSLQEYIDRWILHPDSLLSRPAHPNAPVPFDPNNGFHASRGLPSYSEGAGELVMGVDLVASMYRAFLTQAAIMKFLGDAPAAERYNEIARRYKERLEKDWWDESAQLYQTYYSAEKKFGREEGETFLLWFDALSDPARKKQTIEHIRSKVWNVENTSYLPVIFYENGYPEQARKYLLFLSDPSTPRREYPEVSFGAIDGIVRGLMGIQPSASRHMLSTISRGLPDENLIVNRLNVMGTTISLKHLGAQSSSLENQGRMEFTWKACFKGAHSKARINGKAVLLKQEKDGSGNLVSFAEVLVKPGKSCLVSL